MDNERGHKLEMQIADKLAHYIQNTLWSNVTFVNYLLLPFSLLYSLLRNFRYYFFQTPQQFQSKIICVGNSVSGGAGKTPVVMSLLELLGKEKKIAVVARGYKGSLSNSQKAIKVDLEKHTYKEVGDEAMLIATYADIFISANRKLAIKQAQDWGAEIIILDDGFQDNTVHKDLAILVISYLDIKNKFLIPAGPMRESLATSLRKADIVIVPKNQKYVIPKKYLTGKKIFKQKQVINNAKQIKGKDYILLCAIAQPERVILTAEEVGARIKKSYIYPDHYDFPHEELEKIYMEAKKHGYKVLTTKKDYVRLPQKYAEKTVVLKYHIKLEGEEKLREKMSLARYSIFHKSLDKRRKKVRNEKV